MTVHTVDVSHHDWDRANGRLDWARVAAAGIAAVCVRATYGDPSGWQRASLHGRDMMRGARAAGLITGAYHNLVRGDSASIRRQVDWLRREMDAGSASWAMVDVERYAELLAAGMHPRIGDVRAWCARWAQVEDRQLLVYLPRWVWQHMGSPELASLGYPLVASDYGPNASGTPAELYRSRGGDGGRGWQAYGGVVPALWQYGSNARVPGLSAKTDINAYRGGVSALRALLTGDEDDVTPEDITKIKEAVLGDGGIQQLLARVEALVSLREKVALGGGRTEVNQLAAALSADVARDGQLAAAVQALAADPDLDVTVLAERLAAALAGALPAAEAQQVADLVVSGIGERLAGAADQGVAS